MLIGKFCNYFPSNQIKGEGLYTKQPLHVAVPMQRLTKWDHLIRYTPDRGLWHRLRTLLPSVRRLCDRSVARCRIRLQ